MPPFEISARAASALSEIERLLGRFEGASIAPATPMLRRSLRVKTIQASLAIEGNSLSEEQVTAVFEGRRVAAPAQDLREVQNAMACYEKLPQWSATSATHFLQAHKIMMLGLVERPGHWRNGGVGIAKGNDFTCGPSSQPRSGSGEGSVSLAKNREDIAVPNQGRCLPLRTGIHPSFC